MKASEYFPKESETLRRVIKLKGGALSEDDFDRIFNGHKRIELSREARRAHPNKCRFKDYLRPLKVRFGNCTIGSPVIPLHRGLQQSFLMLCFLMVKDGEINRELKGDIVYYSLIS